LEIQIGRKELMTQEATGALRIRIGISECNEIVDRTSGDGGNLLKPDPGAPELVLLQPRTLDQAPRRAETIGLA
jgi:hypothetical protein